MTAARDWHGVRRAYVRAGVHAPTLRELVQAPVVLDRRGVLAAWGQLDDPLATVVAGVRQLPCSPRTPARVPDPPGALDAGEDAASSRRWTEAFEAAVATIARTSPAPIVALGGGLDAAAVLVAWRTTGTAMPAACTFATGLAGYDEVDDALAIAGALGVRCDVIRCAPAALVALAPAAAVAAETPLYNLHPVHRLALAREARGRGFATLVTGDGADAVFANAPDLDYVPIVAALARTAGLELASPFFSAAVVAGTPRDRTKQVLRAYVRDAGLPWLAERPKRARLVPALDLAPIVDVARIERLAHAVDLRPRLDDDRARVGWATLAHLASALEADG